MSRRASIHITGPLIMLALIGAWYVYHGYQQKTLKKDLSVVYQDYKTGVGTLVKSPEDKAKMNQALGTMETLMDKYGDSNLKQVAADKLGGGK